jgi:hypothetical protein
MERHYQLSVTSDTTNIDVSSVDADEVARIVQLAGMAPSNTSAASGPVGADPLSAAPAEPTTSVQSPTNDYDSDLAVMRKNAGMPPMASPAAEPTNNNIDDTNAITDDSIDDADQDIDNEIDEILSLDEDVAEYDWGHRIFKDEGEEIDEPDLIWQAVENPQRIKGSAGDNGLIQELHAHLTTEYQQYLEETERENDTGVMSPLSDPTKPSFDKDPLSDEEPVDDGSHSPMSTIVRQHAFK